MDEGTDERSDEGEIELGFPLITGVKTGLCETIWFLFDTYGWQHTVEPHSSVITMSNKHYLKKKKFNFSKHNEGEQEEQVINRGN